jgi:hypothetical protein
MEMWAAGGEATATQTFTVPQDKSTLSLWYSCYCPDGYNCVATGVWTTVTLQDSADGNTVVAVPPTCNAAGGWTQAQTALAPTHTYQLTLLNHGGMSESYSSRFDDITVL